MKNHDKKTINDLPRTRNKASPTRFFHTQDFRTVHLVHVLLNLLLPRIFMSTTTSFFINLMFSILLTRIRLSSCVHAQTISIYFHVSLLK